MADAAASPLPRQRLLAALGLLRLHPALWALVLLHSVVSWLVWLSGSPLGTYGLECSVGAIAWDLAHGLNPAVPLLDYFDTFTGGYLTMGLTAAPFTWLPWRSIYAVESGNLLTNAVILVLAWLYLDRNVGRLAALVGTAALAVGPPIMRHHSLIGPGYHYNELLFDFGMAVLWAEMALHGRKTWPWAAAFGFTVGYAVFNCYGSLGFVGVAGLLWWVCDRQLWKRRAAWAFWPGLLVGLAPLLIKGTVHKSYHQDVRGLRDFAFSHTGGDGASLNVGDLLGKLAVMPFDYGGALGYVDTLGTLFRVEHGVAFGTFYGLATMATLPLALVLLWRAVPAGLKGLLPMKRFAPSPERVRDMAALLPTLFAIAFLFGYLTSELQVPEPDSNTSQFRTDRYLPPFAAMLALNVGVVVQLLWSRLAAREPGVGLRRGVAGVVGVGLVAFLGLGLAAQLMMVDWEGLDSADGIPYRGTCYAVETLYAAEVLHQDPERARQFCSGFPESGHSDCYRGFAWAVGVDAIMGQDRDVLELPELPADVGETCLVMAPEWQRECFRQLGWHLISEAVARRPGPQERAEMTVTWCKTMPSPEAVAWCNEGMGFYYADHYAFDPWKLGSIFPEESVGADVRVHIAHGIGYLFAHQYEQRAVAERLCEGYRDLKPELAEGCMVGVADGFDAFERPMPGGPVEPGPLPSVPGR